MKVIQIWIGDNPLPYPDYSNRIAHLSQVYLLKRDFQESFSDSRVAYLIGKASSYAEQSDVFRFWFLSKNPDWTYIDCDAVILKPLDFIQPGSPYFGFHKHGCDDFLIVGNGNPEFFNGLLWNLVSLVKRGKCIAHAQHSIIRRCSNVIPAEYFYHHGSRNVKG